MRAWRYGFIVLQTSDAPGVPANTGCVISICHSTSVAARTTDRSKPQHHCYRMWPKPSQRPFLMPQTQALSNEPGKTQISYCR